MSSSTTPLSLDSQLVNGQVYTFQFYGNNWLLNPSTDTIANDIIANAPDFIVDLVVTTPDFSLMLGAIPTFSTAYSVQFTYEGDGSDSVNDVANSIVAAVQATSGDSVIFVGAIQAGAGMVAVTPSQIANTVESSATSAVQKVTSDAVGVATGAVNQTLQGLLPLLIVAVALILFVLPSLVKSTGTRISLG
jgi:hypothetical protein